MMLIELLRLLGTQKETEKVGWLFALADPQLRIAMTAMHESPDIAGPCGSCRTCLHVTLSLRAALQGEGGNRSHGVLRGGGCSSLESGS